MTRMITLLCSIVLLVGDRKTVLSPLQLSFSSKSELLCYSIVFYTLIFSLYIFYWLASLTFLPFTFVVRIGVVSSITWSITLYRVGLNNSHGSAQLAWQYKMGVSAENAFLGYKTIECDKNTSFTFTTTFLF